MSFYKLIFFLISFMTNKVFEPIEANVYQNRLKIISFSVKRQSDSLEMTDIFHSHSFAETKSIYLPIALHLGWNVFNIVIFSNGPLGHQVLMKANENQPEGIISLIIFLFQIFALPLLVFFYIRRVKYNL